MNINNKEAPGKNQALSSIYKHKLSEEELREIEGRLDQMLNIAWAVFQTLAKEPAKLAELRKHLTEAKKLDPIQERSEEKNTY